VILYLQFGATFYIHRSGIYLTRQQRQNLQQARLVDPIHESNTMSVICYNTIGQNKTHLVVIMTSPYMLCLITVSTSMRSEIHMVIKIMTPVWCMGTPVSDNMAVTICQTTQHHNTEDCSIVFSLRQLSVQLLNVITIYSKTPVFNFMLPHVVFSVILFAFCTVPRNAHMTYVSWILHHFYVVPIKT
jgi:hypothetical protein